MSGPGVPTPVSTRPCRMADTSCGSSWKFRRCHHNHWKTTRHRLMEHDAEASMRDGRSSIGDRWQSAWRSRRSCSEEHQSVTMPTTMPGISRRKGTITSRDQWSRVVVSRERRPGGCRGCRRLCAAGNSATHNDYRLYPSSMSRSAERPSRCRCRMNIARSPRTSGNAEGTFADMPGWQDDQVVRMAEI